MRPYWRVPCTVRGVARSRPVRAGGRVFPYAVRWGHIYIIYIVWLARPSQIIAGALPVVGRSRWPEWLGGVNMRARHINAEDDEDLEYDELLKAPPGDQARVSSCVNE